MKIASLLFSFFFFCAIFSLGVVVPMVAAFPAVRSDTVTISGFASGAAMATQVHVSFSSKFKAVGGISTLPYLCSQGTIAGATACMETPALIDVPALATEAATLMAEGLIDDLANLKEQFVYFASSPSDYIIKELASLKSAQLYSRLNPSMKIKTDLSLGPNSAHGWVTSKYGNSCSEYKKPFVQKCSTSFATSFMNESFIHLGLNVSASAPTFPRTSMKTIDQTNYGANKDSNSMAKQGFVFVPPQCDHQNSSSSKNKKKCHLHIHLHGADQSIDTIYDQYVLQTQFNEFAMTNDVVVLYPQATPNILLLNPNGNWDWYNFCPDPLCLDYCYASKKGEQVQIINEMINAMIMGY